MASNAPDYYPPMHEEALWTLADVAAWLRRGETKAREFVAQEGCPKPYRPFGPDSYPLWRAGDLWEFRRQRAA